MRFQVSLWSHIYILYVRIYPAEWWGRPPACRADGCPSRSRRVLVQTKSKLSWACREVFEDHGWPCCNSAWFVVELMVSPKKDGNLVFYLLIFMVIKTHHASNIDSCSILLIWSSVHKSWWSHPKTWARLSRSTRNMDGFDEVSGLHFLDGDLLHSNDYDPMTTMEPGIWFQNLAIFLMAPKHEPRMALLVSHYSNPLLFHTSCTMEKRALLITRWNNCRWSSSNTSTEKTLAPGRMVPKMSKHSRITMACPVWATDLMVENFQTFGRIWLDAFPIQGLFSVTPNISINGLV